MKHPLVEYDFEDYKILINFESYQNAENYAKEHNGELLEVGFTDGADNPIPNSHGHLIRDQKPFNVELPDKPNSKIYYSYDDGFEDFAKTLHLELMIKENDIDIADVLADQNIARGDHIIVMDGDEVTAVTTRERIKYLMRGNVYELAVKIKK